MKHFIYLIGIFTFLFVSCDSELPQDSDDDKVAEDIQDIADANLSFSWDLFKTSVEQEDSGNNILLSPLSVQTALNMALNGAKGQTQSQIQSVLHSGNFDLESLNDKQGDWLSLLQKEGDHAELTVANVLFSDPARVDISNEFEQKIDQHYNAPHFKKDFSNPVTKSEINNWVKEQTKQKIDGIIEQISPNDIAFLINALYFKADWSKGFDPDHTRARAFQLENGNSVNTDFVNGDRNFSFVQKSDFEAVDIPFKDSIYSLTLMQPNRDLYTTDDWIKNLDGSFLKEAYEQMQYSRAMVQFPILDLSYKKDLKKYLQILGIEDAFMNTAADFSRMGDPISGPNIFISSVAHKSVLKVDEKGAEGAAATSVGFSVTSLPPSLIFDQSFVIVLRHIPTNTVLFIGKVADPTA